MTIPPCFSLSQPVALMLLLLFSGGCVIEPEDLSPKQDINLKIAIVGAGPAGLTAADELRQKGYTNVTVFEKETTAGGKVSSYNYEGKIVEMGAVYMDVGNYPTVVELARRFDTQYQVTFDSRTLGYGSMPMLNGIIEHAQSCLYITPFGECEDFIIDGMDSIRLLFILFFNDFWINAAGFIGAPPTVARNMESFLTENNIASTQYFSKPLSTAYGYGYFEDVPAMYYLKYAYLIADLKMQWAKFPQGWQQLWKNIADSLDVRYNALVTEVIRYSGIDNAQKVSLTINNDDLSTEEFDRIIITAPLQQSHTYLDLSQTEATLFDKIHSYHYIVSIIKLQNPLPLPPESQDCPDYLWSFKCAGITIWEHLYANRNGHVMLIIPVDQNNNVYEIYQLSDWSLSDAELKQIAMNDLSNLGAPLDTLTGDQGIIHQKQWDYFPHVKTNALLDNFYGKLEALQGTSGTYYAGGILGFETVELSAGYAKAMVRRYF